MADGRSKHTQFKHMIMRNVLHVFPVSPQCDDSRLRAREFGMRSRVPSRMVAPLRHVAAVGCGFGVE
jgi:hypothetical protein